MELYHVHLNYLCLQSLQVVIILIPWIFTRLISIAHIFIPTSLLSSNSTFCITRRSIMTWFRLDTRRSLPSRSTALLIPLKLTTTPISPTPPSSIISHLPSTCPSSVFSAGLESCIEFHSNHPPIKFCARQIGHGAESIDPVMELYKCKTTRCLFLSMQSQMNILNGTKLLEASSQMD